MQSINHHVQGCDASGLINSSEDNIAEKDAVPNLTLRGFDLIDDIKSLLENKCKGIVSCADILALATRDAVVLVSNQAHSSSIVLFSWILVAKQYLKTGDCN